MREGNSSGGRFAHVASSFILRVKGLLATVIIILLQLSDTRELHLGQLDHKASHLAAHSFQGAIADVRVENGPVLLRRILKDPGERLPLHERHDDIQPRPAVPGTEHFGNRDRGVLTQVLITTTSFSTFSLRKTVLPRAVKRTMARNSSSYLTW